MAADPDIRLRTPAGRWLIAATVAGSGIAFLDTTVVNVALPHISDDLGGGLAGLQWTLDAYLVTLTSLLLLGGSLGDLYGRRRIFVLGLDRVQRRLAAVRAGAHDRGAHRGPRPAGRGRRAARAEQPGHHLGVVPPRRPRPGRGRRGRGWAPRPAPSGRSSAAGWSTSVSWRPVFFINIPIAAATIFIAMRHVPETSEGAARRAPTCAAPR